MSNEQAQQPLPQAALTHDEAKIIVMALANQIEDLEDTLKNVRLNWTPESRRTINEMVAAAKSARDKIVAITGINPNLPPYEEGDAEIYTTKPS